MYGQSSNALQNEQTRNNKYIFHLKKLIYSVGVVIRELSLNIKFNNSS